MRPQEGRRYPPKLAGLLLGVGLGGFLDGIVLHQLLQWHHMLTGTAETRATTLALLEENTVADGLFHIATWLFVLSGTFAAHHAWRRGDLAPPWAAHIAAMLIGWGAFNLLEGAINHHLLSIHHVRDDLGGPLSWDLAFLIFGATLVLAGGALLRLARSRSPDASEERQSEAGAR